MKEAGAGSWPKLSGMASRRWRGTACATAIDAERCRAWALHDLERCFFRTRLDNLRLYGRLAEVSHRFAEQGLPAIVLKGAYLADAIYADRALRGMADADLLVRRDVSTGRRAAA